MSISINDLALRVMERCERLAGYSEESSCLVRRFATPTMRRVNAEVGAWMRAAGMLTWQDNLGNLVGRYGQQKVGTLLLGSHLDTVRDAGKYDGPLGVLIALACIELLHARQEPLPFALELYAFADEEGLRYHSAFLGSKVVAGTLEEELLTSTDADGISMAEAITIFGGRPDALRASKRSNADLLGYCEVHIEQGPVLETLELPIGVVSAIASYSRILTSFSGQAGHAGTVPMHLRRDALSAAAEFVLACEKLACATPGLVATVGQMSVQPGASNVIPGQVTLSLDVRHMDDTRRERARDQLREQALLIGVDRHIAVEWQVVQEHAAVPCDPQLMRLFSQSIERQGLPAYTLPSGAGHDGVILSALTRVAMLFVRCKGGISHHPAESVTVEDVAVAIQVLAQFLLLLAEEGEQQP